MVKKVKKDAAKKDTVEELQKKVEGYHADLERAARRIFINDKKADVWLNEERPSYSIGTDSNYNPGSYFNTTVGLASGSSGGTTSDNSDNRRRRESILRNPARKSDIAPEAMSESDEEFLITEKPSKLAKDTLDDSPFSIGGLYKKFLSTGNDLFLYRILVKSGAIHKLGSCCNSDFRGVPKDEASVYIKDRLPNEVKSIIATLVKIYEIPIGSKERRIITNIVERLYWADPRSIYYDFISNSDQYVNIIEEFTKRGIGIDEELLQPINFKEFLRTGKRIYVFYTNLYNELTFANDDHGGRNTVNMLQDLLRNIPIIENNKSFETININGVEYNKLAFESIVESDLNNFLINLNVESKIWEASESSNSEENTKIL